MTKGKKPKMKPIGAIILNQLIIISCKSSGSNNVKLRGTNKGAGNYTSTVKKVLDNPERSDSKTKEDLVKAMGGELFIKWKKTEPVVVDYEELKFSD